MATSHARNPGFKQPVEFDLELHHGSTPAQFVLTVTSKIVIDFDKNARMLPSEYADATAGARRQWAAAFAGVVTRKWSGFQLGRQDGKGPQIGFNARCLTYWPNEYPKDYHIWAWMNQSASYSVPIQPNFYRGFVWQLRPCDVEENGDAAHEFGHMIGVPHTPRREGRLMYGNDQVHTDEVAPEIKNSAGFVVPEEDLAFHARWAREVLAAKGFVGQQEVLTFRPQRRQ